ncbi:MAG: GTP-dependent dephospho-CoA kinase family protein [Halorientalis sp.]
MTEDTPADGDGVVVELQAALRSELKDPVGPIFTDAERLLADAGEPIVAVGDIVTYHLMTADRTPDVALVDGRTKRSAVEDHIQDAISDDAFDETRHVSNPPATLSEALLTALAEALGAAGDHSTIIVVDGEEDLAALPAVVAAPTGASVVYGQPNEGMVLVTCEGDPVEQMRELLSRMDGDTERLWAALGLDY